MFAVLVPESTILAADELPADTGDPSLAWITVLAFVLAPIVLLVMARWKGWRPPSADEGPLPTPWRLTPAWGAGLFGCSMITGSLFAGLTLDHIPADASPVMRSAMSVWGGLAGGLLGCLPAAIAWTRHPRVAEAAPVMSLPRAWLAGIVVLFPAIALVTVCTAAGQLIQTWLAGEPPSPLAHATLQLMVEAPRDLAWWLLAAAAILGAPVLEEILYRGFLQQSIRKLGVTPWPAILITAGLFSLMHIPAIPNENRISALAGLMVLGVVLGLLRERTGRLDACIVTHAGFNIFNLALATASV